MKFSEITEAFNFTRVTNHSILYSAFKTDAKPGYSFVQGADLGEIEGYL